MTNDMHEVIVKFSLDPSEYLGRPYGMPLDEWAIRVVRKAIIGQADMPADYEILSSTKKPPIQPLAG